MSNNFKVGDRVLVQYGDTEFFGVIDEIDTEDMEYPFYVIPEGIGRGRWCRAARCSLAPRQVALSDKQLAMLRYALDYVVDKETTLRYSFNNEFQNATDSEIDELERLLSTTL